MSRLGSRVALALVAFGLAVVGALLPSGSATAATPAPAVAIGDTCTVPGLLSGGLLSCVNGVVVAVTGTTTPPVCKPWEHLNTAGTECVRNDGGNHNGDHGGVYCPHSINCGGGGPIPAGSFRDRFDGRHVIVLDGGTNLDACDGSGSYDVFLSRHAQYRDRISRVFPDSDWNASRASCTTTDAISDGTCVTTTTTLHSFQASASRWNDVVGRDRGLRFSRTSPQWRELDSAYLDRLNWQNRYNQDRQLTLSKDTNCQAAAPTVNVTVAPPPAAYVAPAQVSQIPSKAVDTGGWSALFTLAHNRAV